MTIENKNQNKKKLHLPNTTTQILTTSEDIWTRNDREMKKTVFFSFVFSASPQHSSSTLHISHNSSRRLRHFFFFFVSLGFVLVVFLFFLLFAFFCFFRFFLFSVVSFSFFLLLWSNFLSSLHFFLSASDPCYRCSFCRIYMKGKSKVFNSKGVLFHKCIYAKWYT